MECILLIIIFLKLLDIYTFLFTDFNPYIMDYLKKVWPKNMVLNIFIIFSEIKNKIKTGFILKYGNYISCSCYVRLFN